MDFFDFIEAKKHAKKEPSGAVSTAERHSIGLQHHIVTRDNSSPSNNNNNNVIHDSAAAKIGAAAQDIARIQTFMLPPDRSRLIVVGDIHGCLKQLECLLVALSFDRTRDVLLLLGDLVDNGPDSVGVVRLACKLGALVILGNHEMKLLHCIDKLSSPSWPAPKRNSCSSSDDEEEKDDGSDGINYNSNNNNNTNDDDEAPRKLELVLSGRCHKAIHGGMMNQLATTFMQPENRHLVDYLRSLPHIILIPNFCIIAVHAGLHPARTLEEQRPWEIMCMRFISAQGVVSSKTKRLKKCWQPWTMTAGMDAAWRTRGSGESPQVVLFGHDVSSALQDSEFTIGLDTGCCFGSRLSALVFTQPAKISPGTALAGAALVQVPSDYDCSNRHTTAKWVPQNKQEEKDENEKDETAAARLLRSSDGTTPYKPGAFKAAGIKVALKKPIESAALATAPSGTAAAPVTSGLYRPGAFTGAVVAPANASSLSSWSSNRNGGSATERQGWKSLLSVGTYRPPTFKSGNF